MYKLIFTHSYEEKAKKFLRKHPEIRNQYIKCLTLLELNPYHPSLRLHPFKTARFSGYSVSINLSYRISIEFLVTDNEVVLVNVGDHQDIYGKK
jgi:mRNA-degrading endonuclease YafQ of YafQ-DinJ toxin-antitoxin module